MARAENLSRDGVSSRFNSLELSKIAIFLFVGLLLTLAFSTSQVLASDLPGEGTEEEPYEIADWHDLDSVRDNLTASYILSADIGQESEGYDELVNTSDGWDPIDDFEGVFDGDDHRIEDLYIHRSGDVEVGLFGSIDSGEIKDTDLVNINVTGGMKTGGLVGEAVDSIVTNLSASGEVIGEEEVGGLIGVQDGGDIMKSFVNVVVSGIGIDVGGLVGDLRGNSTVVKSHTIGNVTGDGNRVGGLAGYLGKFSSVRDSYSFSNVTGGQKVGGLIGEVGNDEGSEVENTYAVGKVTGDDIVGGLVGRHEKGLVSSSFSSFERTGQMQPIGKGEGDTEDVMNLTDEEMTEHITYYTVGWDIEHIFDEDEDVNDGFPFLSWQIEDSDPFVWYIYDTEPSLILGSTKGGEVTKPGEGIFNYTKGKEVQLEADASSGYEFDQWTGNVDEVGDVESGDTTVEMQSTYEIEAVFSKYNELKVDSTEEGGSVVEPGEGTFEYKEGEEVDLLAEPDAGYKFDQWSGDIEEIGDKASADTTIDMTGDHEITANFVEDSHFDVEILSPEDGVNYGENENILIEYKVKNTGLLEDTQDIVLTVDGIEEDKNENLNLDEDQAFVGDFTWETEEEGKYELGIASEDDSDSISVEVVGDLKLEILTFGDGVVYPEEGNHTYLYGEEVTVNATPDEGWNFSHWTGGYPEDGQFNDTINVSMDGNKTLRTYFEDVDKDVEYNLTVEVEGEGKTDPGEGDHTYYGGGLVPVKAIPDEDWFLKEWDGGVLEHYIGDEDEITVEMDSDKEVTAVFEEGPPYELEVTIEGEGMVDIDPDKDDYEEGEIVNLSAIPYDGWDFSHWEGDIDKTVSEVELTMDSDSNVTAVFKEEEELHELLIDIQGEGSVDVDPDKDLYPEGEEVSLNATPDDGWEFVGWEGDVEEDDGEIKLTMEDDMDVTAVFEEEPPYELEVDIDGDGEVEVDPDEDEYEDGDEVDLTAYPDSGWEFDEWTGDYEGTDEEITLTMDSSKEVTANFVEEDTDPSPSPTPDPDPEPSLTVDPESVDLEIEQGESKEVSFVLENTGDADATVEPEVVEFEQIFNFQIDDYEVAADDSVEAVLVIEALEDSDPQTYSDTFIFFDGDGFEEIGVHGEFQVSEPEEPEPEIAELEEVLDLDVRLDKEEFEEDEWMGYEFEVETDLDEEEEITVSTLVYDNEGNIVGQMLETYDLETSLSEEGEIPGDLPPGEYFLSVEVELTDREHDTVSESMVFVVAGEDGVIGLWAPALIAIILASVAVFFLYRRGFIAQLTGMVTGNKKTERSAGELRDNRMRLQNVRIPANIENWLESSLEKGFGREQLKQSLRRRGKNPDLVDAYFEREGY